MLLKSEQWYLFLKHEVKTFFTDLSYMRFIKWQSLESNVLPDNSILFLRENSAMRVRPLDNLVLGLL